MLELPKLLLPGKVRTNSMFQSKVLKQFAEKKRSKLYSWWVETIVADYYYSFMHRFVENPIFQIKRLYEWYVNVFRFDHDFDGHSLFGIIEYKLKRIQKCLVNGHAYQDSKDMKALSLAIKLANRLKEDKYEEVGHSRTDKKWGEINRDCLVNYSREKMITKEDRTQERKDSIEQYELADKRMKREERILYSILASHLRNWWD